MLLAITFLLFDPKSTGKIRDNRYSIPLATGSKFDNFQGFFPWTI